MRHNLLLLFAIASLAACDRGGSTPVAGIIGGHSTPTPAATATPTSGPTTGPTASPTPTVPPTTTPMPSSAPTTASSCANPTSSTIGTIGGGLSAAANPGSISEQIPAGALASNTTVTLCYIAQNSLPAPLLRAPILSKNGRRSPLFVAGAGNTYVAAFNTTFAGATLASAASETATAVVPATIAAGTQLNIAMYNGTTWVDIATALVSTTGNYSSTPPTTALPGVRTGGTYLVYEPAQGTNTSQINLGFALVADDATAGTSGLQFVQLEDGSGNPIPTPTTTFFPIQAGDLDGQSLTPDAQQGAAVDGGSNVYFFSGIPQHAFKLATATIDVSGYGDDGDSIVSLPSGDEAVVTADGGNPFAVISGILAGSPVIADTVNPAGASGAYELRDGLVISVDGKVMLARGQTGLDVFNVTPSAAHAGSTGMGTTKYTFARTATFETASSSLPTATFEDGRDGMAMSPTDSSRALVVGAGPTIALLTGLNTSTPTIDAMRPQFTPRPHRLGQIARHPEAMPHRAPLALTPAAGTELFAVTITPDGTTGFVSSDAGIITVSGVNTGTLAQVGTAYSPTITFPGGSCQLVSASSLGVLPDGKYLIVDVNCGVNPGTTDASQGSGVVLTIPIGPGGVLGAPVGQLNNVVYPNNDQIIFH